ncbi:MAG: DUF3347 domain-containing protein [Balneolaceae bacterium]|nr:MAG: DUF3347 domain-containing protein [Balneolaceae bacterium]
MRKPVTLILAALLLSGISVVQAQNDDFATRFERMIDQYMNAKDGLVHNRSDLSAAWAERLETTFCTAPDAVFPEDKLPLWHELRSGLVQATGDIVDAENIVEQRKAMASLSATMLDFIEHFGNPGDKLYAFHCPHNGDDGVVWLSRTSRVANPYHGPEMIDCGEVIAEL